MQLRQHIYLKKSWIQLIAGDERAKNHEGSKHNGDAATSGLDYIKLYYKKSFKNATALLHRIMRRRRAFAMTLESRPDINGDIAA